jgi:hypothetical protein
MTSIVAFVAPVIVAAIAIMLLHWNILWQQKATRAELLGITVTFAALAMLFF